MDAKELRLGNIINYVNYDFYNDNVFPDGTYDEVYVTISILESILRGNDDLTQGCYEAILLTEEWLLKFGFMQDVKRSFIFTHMHANLSVDIDDFGIKISDTWEFADKPYVHQLQNLYFALTGEELKINE